MQTPKIINVFFHNSLFFTILIIFGLSLNSCNPTIVEQKYIPNTEGIQGQVALCRFDQDFFNLDTSNISLALEKLKEKHPEFTEGYLGSVLGIRDSIKQNATILGYLNYEDARYTYDTVQLVFNDLTQTQKELNELATHYQYYFPELPKLTKAFAYLSEYHGDRLALVEEGFVGLPLDMALGAGYPPYTFLKIPQYDQRTCTKAHLVTKSADAIAQHIVTQNCRLKGNYLIDLMLFNGKMMYLTDLFLPSVSDSLKFFFSAQQTKACQETELVLYKHLSDEELLYSGDTKRTSKYITKGPFNPALDLPGNSGTWLGYRIIRSFVKENRRLLKQASPNMPARQLDQKLLQMVLDENDPQKFLALYKPPKR